MVLNPSRVKPSSNVSKMISPGIMASIVALRLTLYWIFGIVFITFVIAFGNENTNLYFQMQGFLCFSMKIFLLLKIIICSTIV